MGLSPSGMAIVISTPVLVEGPLLKTEKSRSASPPATIVPGPLAVATRSAAGMIFTRAPARLLAGVASSVRENVFAWLRAWRSATGTEESALAAIVTLRLAPEAVAPDQTQVIPAASRLQVPPLDGVATAVEASIAAGSRSTIWTLAADAGPLLMEVTV